MSEVVGEAVYKIGFEVDKKGLSTATNSIKSTIGTALSDTGKTAKKVGSAIATSFKVGAVAATGAVVGLTKSAVSAYADWEQLIGGVETLFKDSADTIDMYSQQAFKSAGMSANEYMETVTSFSASLLQSLKGDTKKSAEYANRAVIDMSDNANKMGTDISLIQNAYQGFAKQNYTMLDNLKLGYGGTKTEMERLIKDASKLKNVQKKLGVTIDANSISFGNIVNAISVMQEHMGIAGTTAKEASETISGSANMMKKSFENILTFFGGGTTMAWDDIFPSFVESVKDFAKNIGPVIKDILLNIPSFIADIAPMVIESLPKLLSELVPSIIDAAYSIFNTIVKVAPDIINTIVNSIKDLLADKQRVKTVVSGFVALFVAVAGASSDIALAIIPLIPEIIGQIVTDITKPENLTKVAGAFAILFGINVAKAIGASLLTSVLPTIITTLTTLIFSPIGLLIAGIGLAIAGAVFLIIQNWEPLSEFFGALFEGIGQVVSNVVGFIGGLLQGLADFWIGLFKGIIDFYVGFWTGFMNGAKQVWDFITGLFGKLAGFFGSIFSNAWNAVKNVFSTGGRIFAGIVEGIANVFKGVVNAIIRGINTVVAIPFNAINGALNGIRNINILGFQPFTWLPRIGVPQIPYLATGGIVPDTKGGRLIVAGEGGQDEWVVPESKMASLLEQINARGGGGDITVNVYGTFATSTSEQRKVAEVIAQRIQEIQKSRLEGANL